MTAASLFSHDSAPQYGKPFNDKADSETDFLGLGACWQLPQTDLCGFGGARHERNGGVNLPPGVVAEGTGFAAQAIVLHKFHGVR